MTLALVVGAVVAWVVLERLAREGVIAGAVGGEEDRFSLAHRRVGRCCGRRVLDAWRINPLGTGLSSVQIGSLRLETHNDWLGELLAFGILGVTLLAILLAPVATGWPLVKGHDPLNWSAVAVP